MLVVKKTVVANQQNHYKNTLKPKQNTLHTKYISIIVIVMYISQNT